MRAKKLRCPVCGTYNYSGNEYCEKCSGALYQKKDEFTTRRFKFFN